MKFFSKRKIYPAFTCFLIVVVLASCSPASTPTAIPPTSAPVESPTLAATHTPTSVPTATIIVTPTATSTITPTATVVLTPTAEITPTATTVSKPAVFDPNKLRPLDSTFNILLLGSDQRPNEATWRTDTIMIAAVDWQNARVGLVSIPRDLWVNIPGYGMSRINMADFVGEREINYPGGGPALLSRVISETFDIPTQRFARMNLTAFEKAIDTIGGVTVTLECPMVDATPDPKNPKKLIEVRYAAGAHHFDGHEARMYASYRYYSGDWDRARRQQQVLLAIRDQGLRLNVIPKIPQLWLTFSSAIQTDLSFKEIFDLATFGLLNMDMKNVHGRVIDYRLVTPYTTPGGGAVLKPKINEIGLAIDSIFDTAPLQETSARPAAGCKVAPTSTPQKSTPTATSVMTSTLSVGITPTP